MNRFWREIKKLKESWLTINNQKKIQHLYFCHETKSMKWNIGWYAGCRWINTGSQRYSHPNIEWLAKCLIQTSRLMQGGPLSPLVFTKVAKGFDRLMIRANNLMSWRAFILRVGGLQFHIYSLLMILFALWCDEEGSGRCQGSFMKFWDGFSIENKLDKKLAHRLEFGLELDNCSVLQL